MSDLEEKLDQIIPWREGDGVHPYYFMSKENKSATNLIFALTGIHDKNKKDLLVEINEEYTKLMDSIKEGIEHFSTEISKDYRERTEFCNLKDLNMSLITEELDDSSSSVSKKLLKIELLKTAKFVVENQRAIIPSSTLLKCELNNAERELAKIKDFSELNPYNLYSAKKLNLSPYSPLNMGSMAQLFSSITESCEFPIYEKYKMFSYLNGKVPTAKNDLGVNHPGRNETDYLLLDRRNVENDLEELVKKREELLRERSCYLKPKHGACGDFIIHLSYDENDNKVLLKTKTDFLHLFKLFTNPDARKIFLDKNFDGFEIEETNSEEGDKLINFNIGQRKYFAEINYFDEETFFSIHDITYDHFTLSTIPLEFLANCEFKHVKDDDSLIFEVEVDKLSNFLYGLETMMIDLGKPTYTEQEVDIPKIKGNTWEIRQISIAQYFNEEPEQIVNYVKMGGNDYLGGLSKGGHGRETREIVLEAYKQIRPNEDEEVLNDLTEFYIQEVETRSEKVSNLLSQYMNEVLEEKLPDIPISHIVCDCLSTDFMASIIEKNGEKLLDPVLIDINFHFGYDGLKNFDEDAYNVVSFCRKDLLFQGRKFFNDVYK